MLTSKEIDALNAIRWLSTIAIVICHILQGYDNAWAYVFNIGVQIFFFLSGFLYGYKDIKSPKEFYRKRFVKLYIPYAIWVLAALSILILAAGKSYKPAEIFNLVILRSTVSGLGHLWFMKILFICYLILPVFNYIIKRYNYKAIALLSLGLCLLLSYYPSSTLIWIMVYYCGFLCGRFPRIQLPVLLLSGALAVCILNIYDINVESLSKQESSIYFFKSLVAIFLFLSLLHLFKGIQAPRIISHSLTIGGGYEIYLTHGLFILGPLSVLGITAFISLNISIALGCTLISAYLLVVINRLVTRKVFFRNGRIEKTDK